MMPKNKSSDVDWPVADPDTISHEADTDHAPTIPADVKWPEVITEPELPLAVTDKFLRTDIVVEENDSHARVRPPTKAPEEE